MIKDVVIFNGKFEVNIKDGKNNVWLTKAQIADLFEVKISIVSRYINSILSDEELSLTSFKDTDVQDKKIRYYNLDMIIALGYRINSKAAIIFRKWATNLLREYSVNGVIQNKKRLTQLNKMVQITKRSDNKLEVQSILNVLERYSKALDLLDDYDHQSLKKPQGHDATYVITYNEAKKFIEEMKFHESSSLFGLEKDGGFKSGLAAIYQTYDGKDLIPSVEEKAAALLYSLVKNHGFADGNKRIAAGLFVYFLDKNDLLIYDDKLIIDNHTLVALTILIAESRPQEKEIMTNLVMNFLVRV